MVTKARQRGVEEPGPRPRPQTRGRKAILDRETSPMSPLLFRAIAECIRHLEDVTYALPSSKSTGQDIRKHCSVVGTRDRAHDANITKSPKHGECEWLVR